VVVLWWVKNGGVIERGRETSVYQLYTMNRGRPAEVRYIYLSLSNPGWRRNCWQRWWRRCGKSLLASFSLSLDTIVPFRFKLHLAVDLLPLGIIRNSANSQGQGRAVGKEVPTRAHEQCGTCGRLSRGLSRLWLCHPQLLTTTTSS